MYSDQPAAIQADPPQSGLRERLNRGMLSVRPTSKFSPHMLMGENSDYPRFVTKQGDNGVSPLCKFRLKTVELWRQNQKKYYLLTFHVSFFVPTKGSSTLFMNPFMHILKVKILKLHTVLQCPSFRMPWMIWDDSCTTVSECHRVLIPYLDTRGPDHRPPAHYVTISPSSSCHQLSQPRCQPLYCPPLTFLTINNICFASTH